MKRTGFALGLMALLAVPGVVGAATGPTKADTKAASAECYALRAASGRENFKTAYSWDNFGECVSTKAKEEAAERRRALSQARQICRDQGAEGKAFSDCVSETAKEQKAKMDAKDRRRIRAARACHTEQQEVGDEQFAANHGGGEDAFGTCVSEEMKTQPTG